MCHSTPAPASVAGGHDFDALQRASAGAPGDRAAMARLWDATYDLPVWHFISRGTLNEPPRPFCGVVDGRPFVFAFTDSRRADAYGRLGRLYSRGTESVHILETPRDDAIAMALSTASSQVFGILFNVDPAGYFAPLTNLVPMYARHAGVRLRDAAERFNLDPLPLLVDRYAGTSDAADLREALEWVYSRPAWHFLLDAEGADPLVWTDQSGERTLGVFTSEVALAAAARTIDVPHLRSGKPIHMIVTTVEGAAMLIEQRVERAGLQTVSFDMQMSIGAGALLRDLGR